jgi:hypothetical protein
VHQVVTAQPADFSIDAVTEEVTGDSLTGRLVALVLKAGASYFREPITGGWLFRGDNEHLLYWLGHSLPVVILVHDPGSGITYWAHITQDAVMYTRQGWKILIPSDQVLRPDALQAFSAISHGMRTRSRWRDAGLAVTRAEATTATPVGQPTKDDFPAWIGSLIERFRHAVEDRDLWRVLWDEKLTKPRGETTIHAVAGEMWRILCEAADVDMSREANAGRGPVDFKFSAGWHRRALIEVKLLSSSKLRHGAQAQLPQYLASEQVSCAYYMCVGFTDRDLRPERLGAVRDMCSRYQGRSGLLVIPQFIDARPKLSASRLGEANPEKA